MTSPQQKAEVDHPCADRTRNAEPAWCPERLKISQQDGAVLARPELSAVGEMYQQNRRRFELLICEIQGETLQIHRARAREELIELAVAYTAQLRNQPVEHPTTEGLICDGHQPLLFHSGVWAKNFVLGGLAQQFNATALHLVVDNDSWSQNGVMVPTGDSESPARRHITFLSEIYDQPWEETRVTDLDLFRKFSSEVTTAMNVWGFNPLIEECWPAAISAAESDKPLADCLTAVRHSMEERWRLENLELPMSRVCDSEAFRRFFCHVVAHLPCFRELYNEVLAEYRDVNHVRSHTHPVPELKESAGWLESPFWVWSVDEPKREPLYVKQADQQILLAAGTREIGQLDLSAEQSPVKALQQLQQLADGGWRIRSRALTTTLFARLFLSDLFIHGIGGAKYDEMTDRLMTRFYGVEPPGYLTLSGTWHLPFGQGKNDLSHRRRQLKRQIRDAECNPEKILGESLSDELQNLLMEKRSLIDEQQRVEEGERLGETQREHHRRGTQRYRRLKKINALLAEAARDEHEALQRQLYEVEEQLRASKILNSREYSFVLFPEQKLQTAMQALMRLEQS